MKRVLLYVAVVAAAVAALAYLFGVFTRPQTVPPTPVVQVGGQMVKVTVVQTPEERQQGLGGREGLAPDEGMLFVFPEDGKHSFWMKGMRFSIDIVWLSEGGTVVYMVKNVSPDTYPEHFAPTEPARYVLELPAGFVSRYNVSIGDVVRL